MKLFFCGWSVQRQWGQHNLAGGRKHKQTGGLISHDGRHLASASTVPLQPSTSYDSSESLNEKISHSKYMKLQRSEAIICWILRSLGSWEATTEEATFLSCLWTLQKYLAGESLDKTIFRSGLCSWCLLFESLEHDKNLNNVIIIPYLSFQTGCRAYFMIMAALAGGRYG